MEITYQQYKDALHIVNMYKIQIEKHLSEVKKETKSLPKINELNNPIYIAELPMSARLYNALRGYFHHKSYIDISDFDSNMKIQDLKSLDIKEFQKFRGVGNGLINELLVFAHSNNIMI
jgi:hypothetical protein